MANTSFPEYKGWNKSNEIHVYDSETLWEYINGAAEYYNGFGFEKLEWVEYSISEDVYIKAEVYSHSSPINAFGIYAYERSNDGDFLKIGSEGYMIHSALNFYTDTYYVKVYSHDKTEVTIKALNDIAKLLAKNLSESNKKPVELDALPQENKVEHSEKFKQSNYLGYGFLKNAISAKYVIGGEEIDFFSITHETNKNALETAQAYLNFVKSDLTVQVNTILEINDPFNGRVFLLIEENIVRGTIGAENIKLAEKLLGKPNNP